MDIKYLIITSLLYSVTESGCPSSCKCADFSVLCIGKDLESIPSFESLTNYPAIIDLSGNRIYMVDNEDFTFDHSYAVQEIYLNNSEILDIESHAFDELENLQELYLGENLLNSIPEILIEGLPDMILLDISGNHFSGDMPTIRSKSLEVLALANAKITTISDNSLIYLPNLKLLLLQQNNIQHINPTVFDHAIDNSFFVRLSYNVWHCNCETFQLFEYLAIKKFIDTSEPYHCLNSNSEYEDIYDKKGMQVYRSACAYSLLKDGNVANYKSKHSINEQEKQKETKKDKSFSLIKENRANDSQIGENRTRKDGRSDIESVFNVTDEDEKERNDTQTNIFLVNGCDPVAENTHTLFGVHMSFVNLLIIVCSFFIGILVGFFINSFLVKTLDRKLETSDSRTKLIST